MKKFILSTSVVLLGISSAYATQLFNGSKSTKLVDDGYIFNHEIMQCEKVAECNATSGEICTVNNIDPLDPSAVQVFGLQNSVTCNTVLYQNRN